VATRRPVDGDQAVPERLAANRHQRRIVAGFTSVILVMLLGNLECSTR